MKWASPKLSTGETTWIYQKIYQQTIPIDIQGEIGQEESEINGRLQLQNQKKSEQNRVKFIQALKEMTFTSSDFIPSVIRSHSFSVVR